MIFNKIFRIFIIIVAAWIIGCVAFFLSGPAIMFLGSPSWLPLPWSDFDDFVQTPDGKVFVDIRFYQRVLCYDANGEFVASYPYPPGHPKVTGLAVNEDGHVLFRARNILYIYSSTWDLLEKFEGEDSANMYWRLKENGQPAYIKSDFVYPRVPDRVAIPGEYLFRKEGKRTTFRCMDGSQLIRGINHLKRYTAEGELVGQYSGPRLLWIFTFPFPAFLAWPLAFLFGYIHHRKQFLLKQEKTSTPKKIRKRLLLDTSITAMIFIIAAAAIVIGGSVVMFIANSLPKSNPMHFWLVPLVVIPYWITVVIIALRVWRSLLRRLSKSGPAGSEEVLKKIKKKTIHD